jgi:hypothetical protein
VVQIRAMAGAAGRGAVAGIVGVAGSEVFPRSAHTNAQ